MPATDTMQDLREAIVAILVADAGVGALIGDRIVERTTAGPAFATPCLAYAVRSFDPATGAAEVLLTGIADDAGDSLAGASAIAAAAVSALTAAALLAQGLEGIPLETKGEDVAEAGDVRDTMALEGAPNLRQADEVLPLLLFT